MTTIPPEVPPDTNPHTQAVREAMAAINAVMARIPGFAYPGPGALQRISFAASTPDEVLEAVAAAIEDSDPLATAARGTAAELREAIAYGRAYKTLLADVGLKFKALRYTIASKRANATELAFQAYAVAKGLTRPSDTEVLVPHLETMRKAIRAIRGSRTVEPESPEPTPALVPPVPIGGAR